VQHRGKIVTNKIFLVRHLNICVKLLFWTSNEQYRALLIWSECRVDLFAGIYMEWPFIEVIITVNFCCNNL